MEEAKQANLKWLNEFNLLKSKEAYNKFIDARIWEFLGYSLPTASFEVLSLASDWLTWLFIVDDEYDEESLGQNLTSLSEVLQGYHNIICSKEANFENTNTKVLKSLISRFKNLADEKWVSQFQILTTCK